MSPSFNFIGSLDEIEFAVNTCVILRLRNIPIFQSILTILAVLYPMFVASIQTHLVWFELSIMVIISAVTLILIRLSRLAR